MRFEIDDQGLLRNRRWSRPIPAYGHEGLSGTPLPPERIEEISKAIAQVNETMLELIELGRQLRADGHDAVAYQVESFSTDLEVAVEWELVSGDVVTPMERIARIITNTWLG